MTDSELVGETVRVCHKQARIVRTLPSAYRAEIELGGVNQLITLADSWVHDRLDVVDGEASAP